MATKSINNLSQIWNSGSDLTAIKMNVTDTASGANSLLLDLQVGGTSKFNVNKAGKLNVTDGWYVQVDSSTGSRITMNNGSVSIGNDSGTLYFAQIFNSNLTVLHANHAFCWGSSGTGSPDVFLYRDAANTLALRNGANAQAFNIYNTYTDASNYERGCMKWLSNRLEIMSEVAGTGVARPHRFYLHSNKESWIEDTNASGGGYTIEIRNRYGKTLRFGPTLTTGVSISLGDVSYAPRIYWGVKDSRPTGVLNASAAAADMHLVGKYGGAYTTGTGYHKGTGVTAWCGYGATPTTADADGGDAGNFSIWLNSGGAGNGTGAAGADGRFRIINDDDDTEVFSVDKSGNIFAPNLPTSDPAVAGQFWNDSGTPRISAG